MSLIDLAWLFNYPFTIISAYLLFLFSIPKRKRFLPVTIGGIILIFASSFLKLIPGFSSNSFLDVTFYLIVFVLMFFIVHFSFTNLSFSGECFVVACIFAMQHTAHKISVGAFVLIDINLLKTTMYLIVFTITCIPVYAIAYFFFIRRLNKNVLASENLSSIFGILLLMITSIFINYFTYDIFFIDAPNIKSMSFLINFSGLITVALIIIFLYESSLSNYMKRENDLLSLIDSKDKERYELAKITIDEINIKYHDLKHMLKDERLDENEAKEIKETLTNYKTIINTTNRGLNVAVYESQLKCISKTIDLSVLIDGQPIDFMKSHHVYSILSNLLDNSIEAVENNKEEEKRIFLKIYKKQSNAIICLSNPCKKDVKFENALPITSKADKSKHGYGLRSVLKIVEHYDGNMTIACENGTFSVQIIIPTK